MPHYLNVIAISSLGTPKASTFVFASVANDGPDSSPLQVIEGKEIRGRWSGAGVTNYKFNPHHPIELKLIDGLDVVNLHDTPSCFKWCTTHHT